ncbi:hypothetical protein LIER_16494 [Lithospermum erythrorhizon]|uniref:CCHC-type domain-containing protein n=1 Tax=Lithospermum erythrorhizon TaxID=34254 RepID=A0AAV3Q8Q7_LITER
MDAEIICELLGCKLWEEEATPVHGLKEEYLTRKVASKVENAFQGCDMVELHVDKQRKKFFRLKALVNILMPIRRLVSFKVGSEVVAGYLAYERHPNMCFRCGRLEHLIRQCSELEPGSNIKYSVVYGLWIKAPMEKSWVEFRMRENHRMHS